MLHVEQAIAGDFDLDDLGTVGLEQVTGSGGGGVFDGGDQDAAARGPDTVEAGYGRVDRLGAAAGEGQFAGRAADQQGDLGAGVVNQSAGLLSRPVHAGGVRVVVFQHAEHRLYDFRGGAGGGVVIEVNHRSSSQL